MASTSPEPPLAGRSAGLREYLKRGFLYRWNLLLLAGGLGAALLSPFPDALLPLVAAAEAAYLGGLISFPRFRKAIDAQIYHEGRPPQPAHDPNARSLYDIVGNLSSEPRRRFEQVRARCVEMRAIASGVRGRTSSAAQPGEDLSTPALDRLLWVFLRLLVSQEALNRFLQNTDVAEIRRRLEETRARLDKVKGGEERLIRSLTDSIAAQELRLQNYERAQANFEFVRVELDRIEAKIQVLAESSVNRQDPDFLSRQIDSVTESMQSTEKAISDLQEITGLVDEMQEPPAILEADFRKVIGS
jgi:hypothetical protein